MSDLMTRGKIGTNFGAHWRELLEESSNVDPVAKFARAQIDKLNTEIRRYANGAVNQRRGVLEQELNERFAAACGAIQSERRRLAQEYAEKAETEAQKAVGSKSSTDRLADLLEIQNEIGALGTEQLVRHADNMSQISRLDDWQVMLSFKSKAHLDTFRRELRSRGEHETADRLGARFDGLPLNGLGNKDVAGAIKAQRLYEQKNDTDVLPTVDSEGRRIAIPLDELLEGGDKLNKVPE